MSFDFEIDDISLYIHADDNHAYCVEAEDCTARHVRERSGAQQIFTSLLLSFRVWFYIGKQRKWFDFLVFDPVIIRPSQSLVAFLPQDHGPTHELLRLLLAIVRALLELVYLLPQAPDVIPAQRTGDVLELAGLLTEPEGASCVRTGSWSVK